LLRGRLQIFYLANTSWAYGKFIRTCYQSNAKAAELSSLSERVTAAEQRLRNRDGAGSESANAELVERIQRLEAENRRLKQGKAAATKTATADNETAIGAN